MVGFQVPATLHWCPLMCVGQVRNLDEDWRNGCAFLALYNGAAPGELDLWAVDTSDAAANINRGLTLFEVCPVLLVW